MLAYLFLVLAIAVRFAPHAFSFTPVGAALLFFGANAPRKRAWIPLVALAASDILLTRLVYGYAFLPDQFIIWAWYAGMVLLGGMLRQNVRPARVLGASLAAAVSFFVLSNFGVWLAWPTYPHTFAGLTACYLAAIPFFRNELVSDVVFTAAMFSTPVAISAVRRHLARAGSPTAAV